MSLLATISKSISTLLLNKLSPALVEKFSLDKDELDTFLQEFLAENMKMSKKKAKGDGPTKTNGYRLFSAEKREVITKKFKTKNKDANAKDTLSSVSKELGAQWKALSKEKQTEWNDKAVEQNANA